jgi:hypothetical protein
MDRWGHSSNASTGFIVEKWSCRGHPSKRPHIPLQTGVFMKVGGKAPGMLLARIILNGSLTLGYHDLKAGHSF